MSSAEPSRGELIWATRGRSWGFRFLLDGGLPDPLPEYERVFAGIEDEPTAWRRAAGKAALRFPDPDGRRDTAGRVIPHEFVVPGDLANGIQTADEGRQQVWPLVEEAYARVHRAERPPLASDLWPAAQDDGLDASGSTRDDGHSSG